MAGRPVTRRVVGMTGGALELASGWTWSRDLSRQASLARPFSVEGYGLHGGKHAQVRVLPAGPDSGIVFRRIKAGRAEPDLKASWKTRQPALLCSAIGHSGAVPIRTIEHLLASLSAFAVDNAVVEIEGDELPIFDGSAVRWCHNILRVGLLEQDAARRYIRIREAVEVRETSGHFLRIEPPSGEGELSFDVGVSFPGCGDMRWSGVPAPWVFLNDIAPSRSFGLLRWGLPLKIFHLVSWTPLMRGANLFSTGIVWRGKFLGGMRVEDEPIRHRVLDLMGDMTLAGAPFLGHVSGYSPRHELNHRFVRKIMEAETHWEYTGLTKQVPAPVQLAG